MEELYKKKQSDVLRYLLRIRTWQYRYAFFCNLLKLYHFIAISVVAVLILIRQMNVIVRVPHPTRPEKAKRLGYKTKQGFVIYRIRVRRGGRKRQVRRGKTMGKPKNQGVTGLKPKRSLQVIAEERVGRRCPALRILNSYWVGQVRIIHSHSILTSLVRMPLTNSLKLFAWILSTRPFAVILR